MPRGAAIALLSVAGTLDSIRKGHRSASALGVLGRRRDGARRDTAAGWPPDHRQSGGVRHEPAPLGNAVVLAAGEPEGSLLPSFDLPAIFPTGTGRRGARLPGAPKSGALPKSAIGPSSDGHDAGETARVSPAADPCWRRTMRGAHRGPGTTEAGQRADASVRPAGGNATASECRVGRGFPGTTGRFTSGQTREPALPRRPRLPRGNGRRGKRATPDPRRRVPRARP